LGGLVNLNRSLWHVRLFFWSLAIWDTFKSPEISDLSRFEKGTNLCHFMRVIFVWMPLVLSLHLLLLLFTVYVLLIYPLQHFNPFFYVKTAGTIIGVTALALAVVLAVMLIKDFYHKKRDQALRRRGFLSVIVAFFVAKKRKICPTIQFTGSEELD
jgi:hypothetical protein